MTEAERYFENLDKLGSPYLDLIQSAIEEQLESDPQRKEALRHLDEAERYAKDLPGMDTGGLKQELEETRRFLDSYSTPIHLIYEVWEWYAQQVRVELKERNALDDGYEYRIKSTGKGEDWYGRCERCGKPCSCHYKQQYRRKGQKSPDWIDFGFGHAECLRYGDWEQAPVEHNPRA